MPDTKKAASRAASGKGFSTDEKAAMRERARELKAASGKADALRDLLAKIAEMPPADREMAERLHTLITETAPDLDPKTWYGMPAYARKDGKLVVFFKAASKFDSRYATLGFEEAANLDDGAMWPTSYALTKLTAADETRIKALVKQAAS